MDRVLYLKWITSKDLLYSAWNSARCYCGSLEGRRVWRRMDMCICMAESLHCSPEIIMILLISYTPVENKKFKIKKSSSIQFSSSVMSDSLRLHALQHATPPCPSPTPGVHPNPRPLSLWCHPKISSSVFPFSSCPLYFPASGSFQMSQLFTSGGQSIRVSISSSNEQPGLISFRMDWLDLLAVQGTLKSLLQHHSSKASILQRSAFFTVPLSHPYMTTGKTITLTRWTFVGKVMSLLFNMLSKDGYSFPSKE